MHKNEVQISCKPYVEYNRSQKYFQQENLPNKKRDVSIMWKEMKEQ